MPELLYTNIQETNEIENCIGLPASPVNSEFKQRRRGRQRVDDVMTFDVIEAMKQH